MKKYSAEQFVKDVIAGVISGTICALIAVLIVKKLFPAVDGLVEKIEKFLSLPNEKREEMYQHIQVMSNWRLILE